MSERIITDASQDPRFDSFTKRLLWFKCKGESDEAFCQRIEVPYSRFKGWKYRGYEPSLELVVRIAEILDICSAWLAAGKGHRSTIVPQDKVRFIEIPRESLVFYEDVDTHKKGEVL